MLVLLPSLYQYTIYLWAPLCRYWTDTKACITIAIRQRYDYDITTTKNWQFFCLRRIGSRRARIRCSRTSIFRCSRIVVVSQLWLCFTQWFSQLGWRPLLTFLSQLTKCPVALQLRSLTPLHFMHHFVPDEHAGRKHVIKYYHLRKLTHDLEKQESHAIAKKPRDAAADRFGLKFADILYRCKSI